MKLFLLSILLLMQGVELYAQNEQTVEMLPSEKWWGAVSSQGLQMPYANGTQIDLERKNYNNQTAPLLISNKGRYIWSDDAFRFEVDGNKIKIDAPAEIVCRQAGKTMRDAYVSAAQAHFPASGVLPAELFMSKPQYNTWIELTYNQNQRDVMDYAHNIIKNGFPAGVLMIDDNWQKYYGNFEFKQETFPNPRMMVDSLHAMGFKVMLWICPYVSPDSRESRFLSEKGYLIKRRNSDEPAIINWWNGYSACYDLSNPEAYAYLLSTLKSMQTEYGIDGFKFDAGDAASYAVSEIDVYDGKSYGVEQSELWAKMGLEFSYNEYRACWKMGGQALVQRLCDKSYSWDTLQNLVSDMMALGLLGHPYACPDMIGGGEFTTFLDLQPEDVDKKLVVRSCQIHSMMPMMQFSVAPWRVLDKKHLDICVKFAAWHEQLGDYILSLAQQTALTGEPIVRYMEYEYPNQGFELCNDQFMLGSKYLVAPIFTQDDKRTVKLPKGNWVDDQGRSYKGGREYEIEAPIERLPWFEKR